MDSGAPQSANACLQRMAQLRASLPKRLVQCADHLAAHPERVAVSTVADLAAGAGVPPSALIRFCQVLGFSGFSELQRLFRADYSPAWPDYATRLRHLQAQGPGSPALLLAEFIEAGRSSLESLAQRADQAALAQAVAQLCRAEMLHIIGLRRAFPVAGYLAYAFEKMNVPAMLHDGGGRLNFASALRPNDALIAISYAPYSDETLALAAQAQARGLAVVAITDHAASPLARHASTLLAVDEVDFGSFRALSASLALAMALAVAVGSAHPPAPQN